MNRPVAFDLEALWDQSLDEIVDEVRSPAQRRWLADTHPVGFSDDTVVLAAPHAFAREWLETRCGDRIRVALSRAAGRDITVVITVVPKPQPVEGVAPTATATTAPDLTEDPSGTEALDAYTPAPAPRDLPAPAPDQAAPRDERYDASRDDQRETDRRQNTHDDLRGDHHEDPAPRRTTEDQPLHAPGRPEGPTVSMPPTRAASEAGGHGDIDDQTQLNEKYVFDHFVIGSSNRFAHAAASAVAEAPSKAYNPLFIYGHAGLGKTHLLHAIGNYVASLYPRLKVRYVTSEQFTNEFINAIRDDRIQAFQRRYRETDVLLIDDIQFLESKERTQEEFFHTFNALHNAEKQIVISSDRPPKEIATLEDRLRSRFEWGLMTDIQPPDLETRIAILRKKAASDGLAVPPDVLEFIASKVQSNIRELEGALIRVSAFASLQRSPVDITLAEIVLKDLFPDAREQEINVTMIQDEVSGYFQLSVEDLCSPSRSRQLVTARQIAMYLVRELTDLSLPRIGKAFGGRDHTTVMHANSKIAGLMQERRAIYDQVTELTNRIKTRARTA